MDSREYLVTSSKTLSTTTPLETQWNQQMFIPRLKQEIENDIDKENSPATDYNMDECKPLQLSEYLNYYDSKIQVLEHVKKEFPVNEYSQADYSKIICEDMGLVNATGERVNEKYVIERLMNFNDKEKVENKNTEDALSLNRNYEVKMKLERIDEEEVLENVEDTEQSGYTGVHYDVLVTPGEAHCKFCDKIFINSFNLIKHYNEHMRIIINIPTYNGIKESHMSQYSFEHFDRHRREHSICGFCGKRYKNMRNLKRHILELHDFSNRAKKHNVKCIYCNKDFINKYSFNSHRKLCHPDKVDEEIRYQCDTCGGRYGSKRTLIAHIKKTHYDFGRTFACWCGKVFRTPMHLNRHYKTPHDGKLKDQHFDIYRCDHCRRTFNNKPNLVKHVKTVHYDYGEVFKCSCGKEFRTPYHLNRHKRRIHNGNNDGTLTNTVQCDVCQKLYKNNCSLQIHRKSMHNNYNCLDDGKLKDQPCEIYPCDHCRRTFNIKTNLVKHMRRIHYDYGEMFKCWCGKEFRTPSNLSRHKKRIHNGTNDETQTSTVQCDVCRKLFKNKCSLQRHRKNIHYNILNDGKFKDQHCEIYRCDHCQRTFNNKINLTQHIRIYHYDYGKVFECWCGKEFRTPHHLSRHKRRIHNGNSDGTLTSTAQCDVCQKLYKSKYYLQVHRRKIHFNSLDDGKSKDQHCEIYSCDHCQRTFNKKINLWGHMRRVHHDYGRVFKCWCGQEFRTPYHLSRHKRSIHKGNNDGTLTNKV